MAEPISPDQIRSSAYARQLARGAGLRFEPRLEEEFRSDYARRNFPRQRLMVVLGAALVALFGLTDAVRLAGPAREFALTVRFGGLLPLLVVTAVIAWTRHGPRSLERLIMMLLVVVGVGIVSVFYVAAWHGVAYQPEGLYMIAVVGYFLSGLTFWRATACMAAVLSAFVIGALLVHPVENVLFYAFSIATLSLLCAVGAYLLEDRTRIGFLTSAILTEAADHDGLTGIANRRAFDARLDELIGRSLTRQRPLALMLLDLDHFKEYNDRYGHLEGDRCLRQVARVLSEFSRRPRDLAARFGGEEFVLLLYDISLEAARHQAEALRIAIRDLDIPHALNRPSRVITVSIGLAVLDPARGGSGVALLAAADQALYAAKHGGRDRVEAVTLEQGLSP